MKKLVTLVSLFILAAVYLTFFRGGSEEIIPFDHPLFITKDSLISLGLTDYEFIENLYEDNNGLFSSYTTVLPSKDLEPPANVIFIQVQESTTNGEQTPLYSARRETLDRVYEGFDSSLVDDYRNLGDENFFDSSEDKDEHMATIDIIYENYHIWVEVISLKDLKDAENRLYIVADYLIRMIKEMQAAEDEISSKTIR
jgi:hypothetical protein